MIDMLGAFMQIGSMLGGSLIADRRAQALYMKERTEQRKLNRNLLMKETKDLTTDLRNQYLSTGMDPAALNSKISGMYKNIDTILNQAYGPEGTQTKRRRKFLGIF